MSSIILNFLFKLDFIKSIDKVNRKHISYEKIYIQNGYMMIPLSDTIQKLNQNAEIQWNVEKKLA